MSKKTVKSVVSTIKAEAEQRIKSREEWEQTVGSPLEPDFEGKHLDPLELADVDHILVVDWKNHVPF